MRRHLAYLWYVLCHKYFVFMAGLSLRVSLWQLIIHDWHKFTPAEWFPYARSFYKPNGTFDYNETEQFAYAWNLHQKRAKHHWQYWLITWDRGDTEALEMPDKYRREMLADWIGAGRAITGRDNTLEWYSENRHKMKLHPKTQRWLDVQIGYREEHPASEIIDYIESAYNANQSMKEILESARYVYCSDGFSHKEAG